MDDAAPGIAFKRVEGVRVEQDCPTCGERIGYDRAFVPWCPSCEWNVEAGVRPSGAPGRLAKLYDRLHRAEGEVLFRQLLNKADLRPRLGLARVAATVFAFAVFSGWALLVAAGIALVVTNAILSQILGVFVLIIAILIRPRLMRRPEGQLTRQDAPELYRLLDEIAERLGAPRIRGIFLRAEWNAATFRYGIRQRHGLILGLPLWSALDAQQRVALLGHEVAHGVNGDTLNGTIVGGALGTLIELGNMVVPDELWPESGDGIADLVAVPVNVVMLVTALCFYGLAGVLITLTFRDRRRAEFYADRLAASLAGTDGALGLLRTGRLHRAFDRALGVHRNGFAANGLWDELAYQVRVTPDAENERLRRAERRLGSRLDHTHPPPAQREDLLAMSAPVAASLVLNPERHAKMDGELAAAFDRLSQRAARMEIDPDDPV